MNEQKNNGRGVFYGVIGVATLVVAIIGATFAYFTATNGANNVFTGNMATISFGLEVVKVTTVDEEKGGMIPMSNTMVEEALTANDNICVDDNGNAVCQVYRIDVTNTGTATLFLDGYVTLTGGSGYVTDAGQNATNETTMRWAQAFCTASGNTVSACTTGGDTTTGATATLPDLDNSTDTTGFSNTKIVTGNTMAGAKIDTSVPVITEGEIKGNDYDIITQNYIRISDHTAGEGYDRNTDITSALVYNQFLGAAGADDDATSIYIVVWLSETGHNQTAEKTPEGGDAANPAANRFFLGNVVFNSAQGSEVTATFSGYTAVESDQATEA